jgi:hypothetical protein
VYIPPELAGQVGNKDYFSASLISNSALVTYSEVSSISPELTTLQFIL